MCLIDRFYLSLVCVFIFVCGCLGFSEFVSFCIIISPPVSLFLVYLSVCVIVFVCFV